MIFLNKEGIHLIHIVCLQMNHISLRPLLFGFLVVQPVGPYRHALALMAPGSRLVDLLRNRALYFQDLWKFKDYVNYHFGWQHCLHPTLYHQGLAQGGR